MTFYINQCSPQYDLSDPETELFRKLIFSVIIFELVLVMILRIMSGLKNYDLQMIRKGLEDKKKIQEKAIFQTMENLNLNELSQHNNTVITLLNASKFTGEKSLKVVQKQAVNMKEIDTIQLQKGQKKVIKNAKKRKVQNTAQKDSDQSSSSDDESELSQKNHDDQLQDESSKTNQLEIFIQTKQNFINVINIKLTQNQASSFFNILLGHFFVSAALSFQQAPTFYSVLFCTAHGILFSTLIAFNACINEDNNQAKQNSKKNEMKQDAEIRQSEGIMMAKTNPDFETKESDSDKQNTSKKSFKRTFSVIIMTLMLLLNLSLLMYSIISLKQSFFNPKTNSCR